MTTVIDKLTERLEFYTKCVNNAKADIQDNFNLDFVKDITDISKLLTCKYLISGILNGINKCKFSDIDSIIEYIYKCIDDSILDLDLNCSSTEVSTQISVLRGKCDIVLLLKTCKIAGYSLT